MSIQVTKLADILKIGDVKYSEDDLTENSKELVFKYDVADRKIKELKLLEFVLKKTKKSYIDELSKEIIANKSGIIFDDE